jgi:hypothetical protein
MQKKIFLTLTTISMAPAPSKLTMPLSTEHEITTKRTRKASSKITDENYVGAESNAFTKRLKLSAKKLAAPISTQQGIPAHRKASSSLTAESFVGAESSGVTRHLELLADGTARAVKRQRTHSSVEDVEEEIVSVNSSPKNPNTVLEAADGSDDVEMLDPALQSSGDDDDKEKEGLTKPDETAEEQRSESTCCKKTKTDLPHFPHQNEYRMTGCLRSMHSSSRFHPSRLLMDGVSMNSSVRLHIVRDVAKIKE